MGSSVGIFQVETQLVFVVSLRNIIGFIIYMYVGMDLYRVVVFYLHHKCDVICVFDSMK